MKRELDTQEAQHITGGRTLTKPLFDDFLVAQPGEVDWAVTNAWGAGEKPYCGTPPQHPGPRPPIITHGKGDDPRVDDPR